MACFNPKCPDVEGCDVKGICLAVEPKDRLNTLLEAAETHEHMPPCLGYSAIKQAAFEVGYAVAVHGSLRRDFDMVAVPWREGAVGNVVLMQHLCKRVTELLGKEFRLVDHGSKPLGRWSGCFTIDGWSKNIDLSITPGGSGGPEIELWFLKQLTPSRDRTP